MTDYQIALEGMTSLLDDPDELITNFKRGAYVQGFQKFYLKLIPVLDAIEKLYTTVVDKDTMLENMARALAEKSKQIYDSTPKRNREITGVNQSLAMAGFVYPAVLQYKGESSKALCEHLQKAWKEYFPKSNITPASYEDIEKGFHKKWCYITTAACQYRGMDDDCEELNLLRAYRDTYMMEQPGGDQMILDYYDIAPSIVKHINMQPDAGMIYDRIWEDYIDPCIRDIREGKKEECLSVYTDMVMDLKEKYFHLY